MIRRMRENCETLMALQKTENGQVGRERAMHGKSNQ